MTGGRVCYKHNETVEHLFASCKVLTNSKYLTRHNRPLMTLGVTWAKENELVGTEMKNGTKYNGTKRKNNEQWD